MQRTSHVDNRAVLTVVLAGAFVWTLFSVDWGARILHPGGLGAARDMFGAMFHPALSPLILKTAMTASWRTLSYATAGMTVALVLAVPLGILASGVLARRVLGRVGTVVFFRALLAFLRAIHELVWAWLFVAAIGLSPFAAIFALGLPFGGILGRILADMLQDVPEGPLTALRSSGARQWQVLIFGRLPMAVADMLSYTLYRFECAIRSAAIMSFVGLGGLGYQIRISLDDLKFDEVWTFVFFLVVLVVTVDRWSSGLRRRLVAG